MSEAEKNARPVNPHTGQPVPDDPGSEGAEARSPIGVDPEAASAGVAAPGVKPAAASEGSGASAPPPDGSAPSQQELAIRSALETVMDPEIGLSVIDLGLIREVKVLPDQTLIKMMLTTPFCPYAPQIMAEVKQASMSVVAQPCEVEILPDAWSPDLMPDPGLLGYSF